MSEMRFTVNGTTLTIERIFSASKEQVWQAWADPALFAKWWGPRGWETTVKEHVFVAGGSLLYGMKCVDESQCEWYGQESWGKMVFDNVAPHDSFYYTDYFTDEIGTVNEDMPSVKTENYFEDVAGGTKFTSIGHYEKPEDLKTVMDMGMEEGIRQTWDRLEEMLGAK